jgi:xanthine/uracil permease
LTPAAGSGYSSSRVSRRAHGASPTNSNEMEAMDLNELSRLAVNFYYDYKLFVIIGTLILVVLILLKPKPMLKSIGILIGIAAAVYIVILIGEMIFSGVELKEKMINKSP